MIQHVSIEVSPADADACAAFYELLGFARVQPPESLADRATWLQHQGTQIHLMHVEAPSVMPQGHIAVVVDDYDAVFAGLEDVGHEPERRTEHWGSPRAFVRDPAGHRVEIMDFGPPDDESDR